MLKNSETSEAKLIADVLSGAQDTVVRIQREWSVVTQLQEQGIATKHGAWDIRYNCPIYIDRKDLSAVRQLVGKLTMCGKDVANDFETTNEIKVSVRPVSDDYKGLTFVYRSRFRKGGKCRIEESVSPARVYKSLVCRK